MRGFAAFVFVLVFGVSGTFGQTATRPSYAGKQLSEVLKSLQETGLKIVYSSELVKDTMRVATEPKATSPRKVLDEVLAPHGLEVKNGPARSLLIVRSKKAKEAPGAAPVLARGRIAGTVLDARSSAPLGGVSVTIVGLPLKTMTAADGTFTIDAVPAEPQTLFVSVVGYTLAKPVVNIQRDRTTEIVVPLADGTGTYTETIEVNAGTAPPVDPAIPTSQTLRSADLLDLRGVLTDDPFRAIQAMPGVATGDDFRSEFSIRGSTIRHTGVAMDGISSRFLVHAVRRRDDTGSVGLINSDVLDRVTLVSGPAPQERPGRLGGSVDFELREGSRAKAGARLAVSGSNASLVAEGPLGWAGHGSWLVSIRQSYLQWLLNRVGFEGVSFGFGDINSKFVYDFTPTQQMQVTVVAGRAKLSEVEEEIPAANQIKLAVSRAAMVTVGWRSIFGSTVLTQRVSAMPDWYRHAGDFGQELAKGQSMDVSYSARISRPIAQSLILHGTTYLQRESVTDVRRQFTFVSGLPALTDERSASAEQWSPVASGRLTWSGKGGLEMDGGAQVSKTSLAGGAGVSPWLLATKPVSSKVTLRAGISRARQFPDLDITNGPLDASGLSAERSRSTDVGVDLQLTRSIRWRLTLYDRQEYGGLRLEGSEPRVVDGQLVPPDANQMWRNALRSSARGVEAVVERHAQTGLTGWIGYAYGRARDTDVLTQETFWADNDQRHTLNAYGHYRFTSSTSMSGRLRVGTNFPIVGYFDRIPGVPLDDNGGLVAGAIRNAVRIPVYARLDIRANHTFNYRTRRLTLFAEVLNVLGRTNYGPSDGVVFQPSGLAVEFLETLFPLVPSVGFMFEF